MKQNVDVTCGVVRPLALLIQDVSRSEGARKVISPISNFNTLIAATRPGSTRVPNVDPARLADSIRGGAEQNTGENARGQSQSEDAVKVRLSREGSESALATDTYDRRGALRSSPSNSSSDLRDSLEKREQEREQKEATENVKDEVVDQLKERDREVKTHEQAHKSALGPYSSGGIKLEYTTGPDGGRYAVSGSVPVDLSKESEPNETLKKAQTIRKAALAPKEPSSADRRIASAASQLETQARAEIREEKQAEKSEDSKTLSSDKTDKSRETTLYGKLPDLREIQEEAQDSLGVEESSSLYQQDKGSFLNIAA